MIAKQYTIARPGIDRKFVKVFYQTGPQRVKMDVADQFKQIGIFLANYRFVAVLKQMTAAEVAAIESHCIPGQKSAHETGKIGTVAAVQKVEMIRNERLGKTVCTCFY